MENTHSTPQSEPIAVDHNKGTAPGKPDKYIWAIYIFLCIVSIIELYSASSREVSASNTLAPIIRHTAHLAIGTIVMLLLSRIDYKVIRRYIPAFIGISIALQLYVLLGGVEEINGAKRALRIFGVTIQPSELIKLSAVLSIAWIMSKCQMKNGVTNAGVIFSALLVIIFGGLLFTQGLTNTILLMSVSLSMMLIAGIQWKKFFIVIMVYAFVGGMGVIYKVNSEDDDKNAKTEQVTAQPEEGDKEVLSRWDTWMKRIDQKWGGDSIPLYDQKMTRDNRQEMLGYMAQAHGGVFGVLPGNSRETSRLPLANIDYIYSIVVEDWGLVGGLILLGAYLSLLGRAGNITTKCRRAFPALLILGMAVLIAFQALFHMAIVTGVFPVSGQPLPLISKGGGSIIVTGIEFGIMLSVSRFAVRGDKRDENKREMEALPESLRADNPTRL